MTRSQFIAQALLYGDNQKNCVIIIVPEIQEIKTWATLQTPAVIGKHSQ